MFIRYGLYQPLVIPISNIAKIHKNLEFVKRSRFVKRYNFSGFPNVEIELIEPVGKVKSVFIGVDSAEQFISAVLAEASRYNHK
ncbi:hypothetical protein [Pseudoalteromonas prydzensis]|uniref:hypothetical protein n=1 Tax=Pseudoalteromonas prydzensis TaxID=182141 RepID=UPI0026EDB661|nr:hypothetical protein [Pseudoalteromonas prydzensis]